MLVGNYLTGTPVVRTDSRAYINVGYLNSDRVMVRVRSRGGRWITKWEALKRLGNFRLVTLPPEHPRYGDWEAAAATVADIAQVERLKTEPRRYPSSQLPPASS